MRKYKTQKDKMMKPSNSLEKGGGPVFQGFSPVDALRSGFGVADEPALGLQPFDLGGVVAVADQQADDGAGRAQRVHRLLVRRAQQRDAVHFQQPHTHLQNHPGSRLHPHTHTHTLSLLEYQKRFFIDDAVRATSPYNLAENNCKNILTIQLRVVIFLCGDETHKQLVSVILSIMLLKTTFCKILLVKDYST